MDSVVVTAVPKTLVNTSPSSDPHDNGAAMMWKSHCKYWVCVGLMFSSNIFLESWISFTTASLHPLV